MENNMQEAENMTNGNIKNMEGKVMKTNIKKTADTILNSMAMPTMITAINEMIPAEEREVSEKKHSMNIVPLTVEEIIETAGNIIQAIPEGEQAEIDKKSHIDLTKIAKQGLLAPTRGMKGFKTNTGHLFYAQLSTDTKGNHWIEYCQQYSNGSCSGKIRVKQADLMVGVYYIFDKENTEDKGSADPTIKRAGAKIIMNARNDYYNKATFPQECVRIEQIFMLLLSVYNSLPAENDALQEYDSPDKLYGGIMDAIQKNPLMLSDDCHKAYYAFDAGQIDIIANELNMKSDLLLKKLKEHKFLYLTDSSKGYQTYVRFPAEKEGLAAEFLPKSYTKWCYCLLKLEYLAGQLEKKNGGLA